MSKIKSIRMYFPSEASPVEENANGHKYLLLDNDGEYHVGTAVFDPGGEFYCFEGEGEIHFLGDICMYGRLV